MAAVTDAELHAQRLDGQVVLSVHGEIDLENAGRARERIVRAVPSGAQGIVLDLTNVSHLDSAGVRLLFDLARRLHERRQELAVVAPSQSLLRDVLAVVSLDRVAAVAETLDEALAGLRAWEDELGP
ncbi:MAG: STAS domain-containing protein [Actinobacteria bacterium]|nr:MAG: STAS domain-containing protein [Actinomycetota bacterium]